MYANAFLRRESNLCFRFAVPLSAIKRNVTKNLKQTGGGDKPLMFKAFGTRIVPRDCAGPKFMEELSSWDLLAS